MKWIKRIALTLLVVFAGLLAVQYAASETTGEVVVLTTTDRDGATHETRLWIVDHDNHAWLRSGQGDTAGWLARAKSHPQVTVMRNDTPREFIAVPTPDATKTVSELMRKKYTWGDQLIRTLMGGSTAVAVRLDPQ